MAVGLLFLLPGGLVRAQQTIEYPENGTGPIATFTAVDPELAGAITWSLADMGDDDDFEISNRGVLTFVKSPDYEAPASGDENNEYEVTVVATDADRMTTDEAVTVEVTNVDEPGTVTLSAVAPYPGVELTATHSDLDDGINGAEWQWSRSGSKSGSYNAIEDAEEATYLPTSDDVGFYLRATVTYTDGHSSGKSARATSAYTVRGINLPNNLPVFPDQNLEMTGDQSETARRMIEENTAAGKDVGAPFKAGDVDDDILTYTLGDTVADGAFDIDQATGQIKTKADLDFEMTDSYMVTVTATDPAGALAGATDSVTVTITVTDVNEPPAITGDVADYDENGDGNVATFTGTDPEDQGLTIWDLSGADASLFDLSDEGGVLTFKASPNYEKPGDADKDNTYELTVGAKDQDDVRGTKDVEVKVANVDEAGTVTLSAVQPRVGVSLTASLTDIDGPVTGVKWQWSIGGSAIEDATSDTYTPLVGDVGDTLTATATYTDPQGSDTAVGTLTSSVAADTRNKAPVFDDQDGLTDGIQNTEAERMVAEDAAAGDSVGGGVIIAEDPNANDLVSYKLGGPDASSFGIGLTSGQITVGTKLDYETKTSYMVKVIATDSFGDTASIDVTITVTAVNEGPEITGAAQVEYRENGTGRVATFTAVDPELAGAITWSLADMGDDDNFEISNRGVLTFVKSPDYEMAADGDTNNEYEVTVVATDADRMATDKAVMVEVTNVDEPGTVTLSAVAPYPGVELTATHSDLDDGINGAEWQWSKSRSKTRSYNAIEDAEEATYLPTSDDVGFYLRATVTYIDRHSPGKSARATSAYTVRGINVPNNLPVFPDQNLEMTGDQSETARRMIEENTAAGKDVGAPFKAGDVDDDILTYTLGDTVADGAFDIDQATGRIKTKADLDFDMTDSYMVTVTATDPAGDSDSVTVTITVTDVNEPPAITGDVADYDENGDGNVATFTGTDPEDQGLTIWDLSGADASLFDLSDEGGVLTFKASPNYEKPGDADKDNTYELTVGAKDQDDVRGTKDVEVKVANVDEAGTVTLSAVQPRVGVSLTASLTDIDGPVTGVKWQWSIGGSAIEDATSDTYTPLVGDVGDTLTATATYTDPQGSDTAVGTLTSSVAADTRNKAPVFDDQDGLTDGTQNTEAERMVAEDAAAGDSVGGGVIIAEDPNANDLVSYKLGGPDASSFDIGLTSGQITVGAGTKLDYETKTSYMVKAIATDSFGDTASIDVTITVTDVNEGPVITFTVTNVAPEFAGSEDGARSVAENTVAGEDIGNPVAASDANGDALTYALRGTDAASFYIDTRSGQLMTLAALDYETKATYSVTVTASDSGGLSDSIDVTITVTDVVGENVAPEFADSEDGARSVAENTAAGEDIGNPVAASDANDAALTYALSGTDAESFAIDSDTGQLMTLAALDYETKATYSVTVTASDSGGLSASIDVTITVTDVDEAPVIAGDAAPNYAENGTGPVATYSATDPESATITWSLEGDDAADFEISAGGVLTFNDPPDYETKATYSVTVTASDSGGLSASIDVTITVTDVDEAPVIAGDAAPNYAENGTGPVATYSATDPESATITWSLEGDDAADFEISAGGVLTFNDPPDYETKATYSVTVTASDSGGLSDSIDVTITVTDVDEAPVIAGDAAPNYAENGTGPVATYSATDPESATITWSLEGDDAADFEISAGGVLTFNDPPDYEMPGDADEDNAYEVTAVASDGESNAGTRDVTVKVTNVDEDGTVTLSALQPRVGVALTASLTDPDGGVTGVTWQWASSDAMDGTFADIDGATSDSYTPVEGDAGKYLRATAMYTDEEGSGKSAEAVSDNAVVAGETQDPLLTRYDANSNGKIDQDEVITAINDYLFEDGITRDQVIDVLNLYLFDFDS